MKKRILVPGLAALLVAVCCSTVLRAQDDATSVFQVLKVPFHGVGVTALSATSPSNIFTAAGNFVAGGALNFDGKHWHERPVGGNGVVTGMATTSPSDAWTVGWDLPGGIERVEHFDGKSWSKVKDVELIGTIVDKGMVTAEVLNGISALSPDDIYAAGWILAADGKLFVSFFEHWDGKKWSLVSHLNLKNNALIYSVSALSHNDVWAVGYVPGIRGIGGQAQAFHWDGTKWTLFNTAPPACYCALFAVTAIAPDDVWALGNRLNTKKQTSVPIAEHWDGHKWSFTPVPDPGINHDTSENNEFKAVAAVSSKSVWAGGSYDSQDGSAAAFAEHWDGSKWNLEPLPSCRACSVFQISALPSGAVWLGAQQYPTINGAPDPFILFTNKGE
jgi:hypothetical protein